MEKQMKTDHEKNDGNHEVDSTSPAAAMICDFHKRKKKCDGVDVCSESSRLGLGGKKTEN